jgi:hypothetical protein
MGGRAGCSWLSVVCWQCCPDSHTQLGERQQGGGMQKLASTKQSGESSSSSDGAGGDQGQQMGSMLLVSLPCLC